MNLRGLQLLFSCLLLPSGLLLLAGCSKNEPAPALPVETEVTFLSDGLKLSGSVLMPPTAAGQKVPAMLLLPGSGPTDRDGNTSSIARTDLLQQLAHALAIKGIASLRFDKRAIARYQASWPKSADGLSKFFSYEHFVGDAKVAYGLLRHVRGVDPNKVGILGHSEGGLFAIQIAHDYSNNDQAPFKVVLMSAAGRTFGPVVHDQLLYRMNLAGTSKADIKRYLTWWDGAAEALAKNKPLPPKQPNELMAIVNPSVMDLSRSYCQIDPAVLLAKTTEPVLILNGSDDLQVSPKLDAERLNAALAKRPKSTKGSLVIIPGVSHNYKLTADGMNKDNFVGPVEQTTLDDITSFVLGGPGY